jgi:hypothetical protein
MRREVSDPPFQIQRALFAVRLVNNPVNMQRPENVGRTVVSDNHNAIATRRDEGVIQGRHCVFMPV